MKRRLFTGAFIPTAVAAAMVLASCGSDDPSVPDGGDGGDGGNTKITQAILVYMNAENNLTAAANNDLAEMLAGSKSLGKNTAVYAFVDQADSSQKPYVKRFYQGEGTVLYTYDKDFIASDPSEMTKAIQKMIDLSEATDFSMILWGHGTGSLMTTDTVTTTIAATANIPSLQAYGYDSNNNTTKGNPNYWINTPALARVFSALKTPSGAQMKFQTLFCDCCCMQNTENAYEFRNNADYYVAIATETPYCGADYTTALPAFNKTGEECAKAIIDAYVAQFPMTANSYKMENVCIAAVRMNQMDNLMNATTTALQTKYDGSTPLYLKTSSSLKLDSNSPTECIHYAFTNIDLEASTDGMKILYDVKDIMRENISKDAYETWLNVFNQTVFYAKHPDDKRTLSENTFPWMSEFITPQEWYRFYLSDETCGCMNTTFPVNPSTSNYSTVAKVLNERHMQLQWWQKIWKNFGF